MADIEKRLDDLENEETERDIVITCVEEATVFNEQGMRMPVHPEPIGFDEGCWRPTHGGRMRVRWAIYPDHRMLRDCDREEQGLPPLSDHGIIKCDPVTGD